MKITLLSLVALLLVAVAVPAGDRFASGVAAQPAATTQPDPRAKDAEPLPELPKANPNSKVVPLNPDKTFFLEVLPNTAGRRVLMAAEVCLREGPLEVFMCRKGTKEHEAIVRVDLDAKLIHAALEAAGAKAGSPPQFVNPKTGEPEFKPASGTKIKVIVHYKKDGKLHTRPAQEWIWNGTKKKPLEGDWVFAGSQLIRDPDNPKAEPYYGANSGEFISVSNFPYSMLELPVEISKDDAALNYEAKTDRIPPLFSKVWVILEPAPEKK